jgi:hypothetical protein
MASVLHDIHTFFAILKMELHLCSHFTRRGENLTLEEGAGTADGATDMRGGSRLRAASVLVLLSVTAKGFGRRVLCLSSSLCDRYTSQML